MCVFKRAQTDDLKKKKKKANEVIAVHIEQTKKYCSFYTFIQQALQHYYNTFIFNRGWS